MWLKTDAAMPRHPKTLRLAAKLGSSRQETVGVLMDFFVWVRTYAETGYVKEWDNAEVCLALDLRGKSGETPDFFGMLENTGWLEQGWIKNWDKFGGAEITEKAKREPVKYQKMIDKYGITPYGEIPGKKPEKTRLEERRGEERREEEKYPFVAFWGAYPKSGDRGKPKRKPAEDKWSKLGDDKRAAAMAGLPRHKASPQWQKNGGQFIPAAVVYLNQELWNDETGTGGGGHGAGGPQGGPLAGGTGPGRGPKTSFGAKPQPAAGDGAEGAHG